ncbi:MAG: HlyC/CorC family transporter [Anaerolineales bacterium]|nr:HlyC/CorC family transporter [Anaerolineales bacterium]
METEIGLAGFLAVYILDLLIAATRVSLSNVRPLRLLGDRGEHSTDVEKTLALVENQRLKATLRLSQTLVRFSLAGLTLFLFGSWFTGSAALLVIQVIVLLIIAVLLMVSELGIEAHVRKNAERWALRLYGVGRLLVILFKPLVYLPLRILGPERVPTNSTQVTEDELKSWVESSDEDSGSLEREERQMIYSIFQFGETLVREIMVPRVDILALDVNTSLTNVIEMLNKSGHSRVPVFDNAVDNVLGLLYAKDLLRLMDEEPKDFSLRDYLRPAYFIPETKKADDLLTEMQSQRTHLGIVVDEYGGVAGLVTMEDIVEEIVGEIQDEYDPAEELLYQSTGPDEYLFQGRIDLDDFNQVMGSYLPKVEADTLAGFLYDQLGRVPQGGESIQFDDLLLTIEQVSGRRIRRVRAHRVAREGDQGSVEVE